MGLGKRGSFAWASHLHRWLLRRGGSFTVQPSVGFCHLESYTHLHPPVSTQGCELLSEGATGHFQTSWRAFACSSGPDWS